MDANGFGASRASGAKNSAAFSVDGARVDPARNIVSSSDGDTHVEPRAMRVLCALASRPGDVVTRGELLDAAWDNGGGSDEALTQAISRVRGALGDDARAPRVIETIPKRGYRLLAPITRELAPASTPVAVAPSRAHWRPRALRPFAAPLAASVAALAGALGMSLFNGAARPVEERVFIFAEEMDSVPLEHRLGFDLEALGDAPAGDRELELRFVLEDDETGAVEERVLRISPGEMGDSLRDRLAEAAAELDGPAESPR